MEYSEAACYYGALEYVRLTGNEELKQRVRDRMDWGEPNETTFGTGLRDQFTTELFCRLQVSQNIQVTPDIQWIIDPALNPKADESWIFGIRARVVL